MRGCQVLPERFWNKVEIADKCWLWTAGLTEKGYGYYANRGGSNRAHRAAYEALLGPVPAGLVLDHLCHTQDRTCPGGPTCPHRRCVNPAHLEPVTHAENARRGLRSQKTHCPEGHEYVPEYLRDRPGKGRECATCHRMRWRPARALAPVSS